MGDLKHRLHVVRWKDAHGNKDEDVHDVVLRKHKPVIYISGGILVHSDQVGITLAMDLGLPLEPDEELSYRQRTFIPRELVIEEWPANLVIKKAKRIRAKKVKLEEGI